MERIKNHDVSFNALATSLKRGYQTTQYELRLAYATFMGFHNTLQTFFYKKRIQNSSTMEIFCLFFYFRFYGLIFF